MRSSESSMRSFFLSRATALIAVAALWLPAAQAADGNVLADSLRPDATRSVGKPLHKSGTTEGGGKWVANQEVVQAENGVTANGPASAHLALPVTAGRVRVEADIFPKGSGFVGLVIGKGDLTNSFWQSLAVMVTVWHNGRYNVFAAGKNLIDEPENGLVSVDRPTHTELLLDTVSRTVSVKLNGRTVLENAVLPKAVALDRISAAGFHFQEPVQAGQPRVSNFKVERENLTAAGLEPVDYADCFVEPDKEATLRWRASDPGPKREIPYFISDYWNQPISSGTVTKGGDGIFTLQHTFARGYAEIHFPESGQVFGIVSLEAHVGVPDPFFCIDAGLTWLEQNPTRREGLVKIMARSGIAMARERFDAPFGAAPHAYNWEGGGRHNGAMRETYAKSPVSILEILGVSKEKFGMAKGQAYPQNLPVMASEWSGVAKHFDNVWGGAEIYNEPDLKTESADQYVPMVKAFSYSLAQAGSPAPLVAGVLATAPPGPYFETCAANGMFADADVVSFHGYDKATDMIGTIGHFREWLKKSNVEAIPLWMTECGKPWANGPARPPQDQDALSACEITAMGIEAMAGGVARYFPFVFVYYEEGAKNFGMMGREATPLRSMSGYVQGIRVLAGSHYVGDLQGLDPAIKLARVFSRGKDGECVAVLYTGKIDEHMSVPFPFPALSIEGVDGRALMTGGGKVPIPDGLSYVRLNAKDVGAALATDTAATALYEIGKNPLKPKRLASPVILQLLAQDLPARASARRYLITQDAAHELPIHVRLHNLSEQPLQVTPAMSLPGGSPEEKSPVTVPAMGYVDVAWKPDATKELSLVQTRFITVTAKSSGDVQPSPLAIPIAMEGTLEQHLATHKSQVPLPIADLPKWRLNSAPGKCDLSVTSDGHWRMDCSFSANQGNWTFPRFILPATPNPAVDYGFLIRARVDKAGHPAIIARTGDGPGLVSFWVSDIFPADGQWHVAYIPFAEFKPGPGGAGNQNTRVDPAAWKILEIGMTSNAQQNGLEISHFIVVGGTGGDR
ncbi:MAG TPA: hypothetical protein VK961_26610 [Chthoniobacter sp.]|nr:hypothetical protein [Chthoniobacter sp.]